jgi:hypothetical protein
MPRASRHTNAGSSSAEITAKPRGNWLGVAEVQMKSAAAIPV